MMNCKSNNPADFVDGTSRPLRGRFPASRTTMIEEKA
jgi:hypothetical protein